MIFDFNSVLFFFRSLIKKTCLCAKYHGFCLDEMEYLLFQYTLDQVIWKSNQIMDTLLLTLEDLENYSGDADLGVAIAKYHVWCKGCMKDFSQYLDEVKANITMQLGVGYQFIAQQGPNKRSLL